MTPNLGKECSWGMLSELPFGGRLIILNIGAAHHSAILSSIYWDLLLIGLLHLFSV